MPVYEYLCSKCQNEFEVEQRITDDPIKSCPRCRSRKVKRLISQTSFVLKGSGWYSDLYSSSKPKAGEGSEGASESKDSAAKDSSSEAAKGGKGGKSESASKKDGGGKKKPGKAAA